MVGNIGATFARGLQGIASRVTGGETRAAGEGSFLGRAVQWLKGALHIGNVRPDTAQAYAGSVQGFMAAGTGGVAGGAGASSGKIDLHPCRVNDEIKNHIERNLVDNLLAANIDRNDIDHSSSSLCMTEVQGKPNQYISAEFITDVKRQTTSFDKTTLSQTGDEKSLAAKWHSELQNAGVSSRDISVLSVLCNQSSALSMFTPVFDPQNGVLKTTDDQKYFFGATPSGQTYHITTVDRAARKYQIEVICEGDMQPAINLDTGAMTFPEEDASCKMNMIIDLEPDASDKLTVKNLAAVDVDIKMVGSSREDYEKRQVDRARQRNGAAEQVI